MGLIELFAIFIFLANLLSLAINLFNSLIVGWLLVVFESDTRGLSRVEILLNSISSLWLLPVIKHLLFGFTIILPLIFVYKEFFLAVMLSNKVLGGFSLNTASLFIWQKHRTFISLFLFLDLLWDWFFYRSDLIWFLFNTNVTYFKLLGKLIILFIQLLLFHIITHCYCYISFLQVILFFNVQLYQGTSIQMMSSPSITL